MTYEIRAAYNPGRSLTMVQRTSSHFTFAPRVGTTTLRPGFVLRLDDAGYEANKATIDRLLAAEAITVTKEGEEMAAAVPVTRTPSSVTGSSAEADAQAAATSNVTAERLEKGTAATRPGTAPVAEAAPSADAGLSPADAAREEAADEAADDAREEDATASREDTGSPPRRKGKGKR